jgi:hypothetical protein
MPQIREYRRQVGAPAEVSKANVQPIDMGQSISQAATTLRGELGNFAEVEYRKQSFEAQMQSAQEQSEIFEEFELAKQNAAEGAEGFTEAMRERLDQRKQSALENAKSDFQRQIIEARYTQVHNSVSAEAIQFEAKAKSQKLANDMKILGERNNNIVRVDPTKVGQLFDSEAQTINAVPFLNDDQKRKLIQDRMAEIHDSALDGEVTALESDPMTTAYQVKNALENLKQDKNLYKLNSSSRMYDNALTRLQKYHGHLMDREQAEMFDDFKESMDQIKATGVDNGKYKEEWIQANVRDERKRERMVREQSIARAMGQARNVIDSTSFPEAAKLIEQRDRSNVEANTDEFYKEAGVTQVLKTTYLEALKEFKDDSAGYVTRRNDSVGALFDNFMNAQDMSSRAAAFKSYADAAKVEQERVFPGTTPRILPKEMTGRVANLIDKAIRSAGDDSEKAQQNVTDILQDYQAIGGKHWHHMTKDLKTDKALNGPLFLAANMYSRPDLKVVADRLVRAGIVDDKTLSNLVPEGEDGIKKRMSVTVASMKNFLETFGGEVGAEAIQSDMVEAVARYSMVSGVSAEEAYDQTLGQMFNVQDGYRVPVQHDEGLIEYGLDNAKSRVQSLDIVVPKSMIGLKEEDSKRLYMSDLEYRSKWRTTSNNEGLYLVDGMGNMVYRRDTKGEEVPVMYSWDELKTLSAELPVIRSPREGF